MSVFWLKINKFLVRKYDFLFRFPTNIPRAREAGDIFVLKNNPADLPDFRQIR